VEESDYKKIEPTYLDWKTIWEKVEKTAYSKKSDWKLQVETVVEDEVNKLLIHQ
jgi:hypothetical protein